MDKIGFGIIGCGVISGTHRTAMEQVEAAELIACCDVIEERAKAFAEEAELGDNYYRDLEDMLARDDIQVACVCTPSGMHSEHAIAAAQAQAAEAAPVEGTDLPGRILAGEVAPPAEGAGGADAAVRRDAEVAFLARARLDPDLQA